MTRAGRSAPLRPVVLTVLVIALACSTPRIRTRFDISRGPLPPVNVVGDPGPLPWVPVPREQVREVCRLDPDALDEADDILDSPWAVIRYGRLCHQYDASKMRMRAAYSVTKTVGALVTGMVAYQTRALSRTGRKTGPLRAHDRVDHWLDSFSYNQDARVGHVLGMVAHSQRLQTAPAEMEYDVYGRTQVNSLDGILTAAIRQDRTRLGDDLEQFTSRYLFAMLGMKQTSWSGHRAHKTFAYSLDSTVLDLARVGQLMLRGGTWAGNRLLDAAWVYDMTHPSFEQSNAAYGYLTWLNAAAGYHFGGIPHHPDETQASSLPGPCAPSAIYRKHPHGLSRSADCNYGAAASCRQTFDVGVWQAVGLGGHVIQGHPGLDMVLVVMGLTPFGTGMYAPGKLWNAVRPAVVEIDPRFRGNDAAFCAAYGAGEYAPDWVR